jgi:hypothetical protein
VATKQRSHKNPPPPQENQVLTAPPQIRQHQPATINNNNDGGIRQQPPPPRGDIQQQPPPQVPPQVSSPQVPPNAPPLRTAGVGATTAAGRVGASVRVPRPVGTFAQQASRQEIQRDATVHLSGAGWKPAVPSGCPSSWVTCL